MSVYIYGMFIEILFVCSCVKQFSFQCVHVLIIRYGSRRKRILDRGMSEGPAQMKWLHTRCGSDSMGYNYLQRSLVEVKVGGSFLFMF